MEKSCVNGEEIRSLEFKIVGCNDKSRYYEVVITAQSHYGNIFTPDGNQFYGQDGAVLASHHHPDFSEGYPKCTFHVRGLHRESDLEVMKIPFEHFSTFVSLVMRYNRLYGKKVEKDTFLDITDTFVENIEEWWRDKVEEVNKKIESLHSTTTIERAREAKKELLLELLFLPRSFKHCPDCLVQAKKHERRLGKSENCEDCPFGKEKGICILVGSTYDKLSKSLNQTRDCIEALYS